jgi:hypothetical protein
MNNKLDIDFEEAFKAFNDPYIGQPKPKVDIVSTILPDKDFDIIIDELEKGCINCGHEINDGDFGKCYELMENDNIVKACDCRRHYNVNK